MTSEQVGLVLRGTLLNATSREVRPKNSPAFTAYEVYVLAGTRVHVVAFYNADEMTAVVGSSRDGDVIELPVYTRVAKDNVYLHYRRGEQAISVSAA